MDDVRTHGGDCCAGVEVSKEGNGRKVDGLCDPDGEGGDRKPKRRGGGAGVMDLSGGVGGFYGWPSSRIVRVSQASGGKDRHSKVLTSKGLRDRRVRLSVNTAIQFYDLQDRLGYDQPSKAVEWLLRAAASSIQELPPISGVFPGTPKQLSDENRACDGISNQLCFDSVDADVNGPHGGGRGGSAYFHPQPKVAKSSACSSPSGTSEGSGLSLSRSVSRIRARDRAKERIAAKEEATEKGSSPAANLKTLSQTTSFTELLGVGLNNLIHRDQINRAATPMGSTNSTGNAANESRFFQNSPRQWSSAPMDYFTNSLLGPPATSRSGHMFLSSPLSSVPSHLFSLAPDHHQEMQQFAFVPDHLVSVVDAPAVENRDSNNSQHNGSGNEYSRLNFSMSSSSPCSSRQVGFNRGTLQSNSTSPSLVSHLQRLPPIDGPPSFFIGSMAPVENHHQVIYYGNARCNNNGAPSGQKEKEKN